MNDENKNSQESAVNRHSFSFKQMFGFMDLTKGKPIVVILLFSVPLVISLILTQGLSLINSLVCKITLDGNTITSMNQVSPMVSLIFNFTYGCSAGFAVLISQRKGAKDQEGLKKVFNSSIFLCLVIAAIAMILGFTLMNYLIDWLNISELYAEKAKTYFIFIICYFPFTLFSNFFFNVIRSLGNSFFPLILSISLTALHILLVYLFTSPNIGNLGIVGAGITNAINAVLAAFIAYIYIIRHYKFLRFSKEGVKPDWKIYLSLIKLGLPLGLQWSVLYVGSFVQNSQINIYGPDAGKAVACYGSIESYASIPLSAMNSALLSYVGQNYGAKKYRRIKQGIFDTFIVDVISCAIMAAIFIPLIPRVPYVFLPAADVNENVIRYCSGYLYVIIPSLTLQATLTICRATLQGIKKPMLPFASGVGELGARIFICLLIPYLIDPNYKTTHSYASYQGLCFSTLGAWLISVIIMGISVLVLVIFNKKYKEDENIAVESKEKEQNV